MLSVVQLIFNVQSVELVTSAESRVSIDCSISATTTTTTSLKHEEGSTLCSLYSLSPSLFLLRDINGRLNHYYHHCRHNTTQQHQQSLSETINLKKRGRKEKEQVQKKESEPDDVKERRRQRRRRRRQRSRLVPDRTINQISSGKKNIFGHSDSQCLLSILAATKIGDPF